MSLLRNSVRLTSRHARRALSSAAAPPPPAAEAAADDAPAMTQVYGGLKDEDRIVSNIYGEQDWRLKDAEKRGDWYRTKDLMWLGPDGIVNDYVDYAKDKMNSKPGEHWDMTKWWECMPFDKHKTVGRLAYVLSEVVELGHTGRRRAAIATAAQGLKCSTGVWTRSVSGEAAPRACVSTISVA